MRHVVIIGGGITGLSAAFYLQRAARAAGLPLHYTLIERDERLGGKIRTDTIADPRSGATGAFVVEGGPDSFITQKPWAVELTRDLGLAGRLMPVNAAKRPVFALINGRPRPLPSGLMLVVPTKLLPFVFSPLLSPLGKLRMALDLLIPPRRNNADETLAGFIRRRLGAEALDRLAEPILAGIYSADAEQQSILATFPQLRTLETRYGGLVRGMLAQRRATLAGRQPAAADRSPFVTLRGGVGELVGALERSLAGRILTGRQVTAIEHNPYAAPVYTIRLDDGQTLTADVVLLTTPAFVSAALVAPFQPDLSALLKRIRYTSTGTITLAYQKSDIGDPLDGFGLVIPRSAGRQINACTISSLKFAHRAPDDAALVRVFVGGSRRPEAAMLDDEELLALARAELQAILGISAEPLFARIYRWPHSSPQYDLGHIDLIDAIEAACPIGLYVGGSAYRGVGIPDCARQGRELAEKTIARLEETTAPPPEHHAIRQTA